MYADVIIDISHEQLDKTFQYAVPDELADVIELGMSVDIPFGAGNRQITGYVVGFGDKAAYPVEKIKYITGITEGKVCKPVKDINKLVDIGKMQSGGRLIKNIYSLSCASS